MSKFMVTNDAIHGLSYIYLVGKTPPGGVKRTIIASPDINLDFDENGCLIGIELLRQDLLHPSLKEQAVLPGKE